MKPENKAFLDAHRHHYDTLIKAFYMKGLNANERDGMVRVMREEFQPGYNTDLWCSPCVADMVRLLYQRYDLWISLQPKEEPAVIENVHATFPKQDQHEKDSIGIPNIEPNPSNGDHSPKRHPRRRK